MEVIFSWKGGYPDQLLAYLGPSKDLWIRRALAFGTVAPSLKLWDGPGIILISILSEFLAF